ncbi:DUF4397 domain-containing protein [Pedobacter duraquae]|uniref:Uncharacterized protein DUF4397 n=1 Tax=Pedobacter duraquae TaxID=425511 RepID=A0A4R6IGG6_9SPHI|nr:DUF4397 domain-containing protein [Pedobacter duraquae]TDO20045.1 uncharacterized protein DUF4397 [Pedobacter duraquae]
MKRIIYLIVVSIGLLTSCKKQELVETTVYEKIQPADPKYSFFKVVNLSAGSPAVNYFLDGTKSSGLYSTTGVEGGVVFNGLFPSTGYAVTTPGNHTLSAKLTTAAVPVADRGLEVFTSPYNMAPGKYYTIVTGGVYNTTSKKIESSLVFEDTKIALDTSKIFIRFANLYTGSPNVDLIQTFGGVSTKIATNVAFGKTSDFASMPNPGKANVYSITNSATGAVVASFTTAITLVKGTAVTLYLRGVAGNATYPPAFTFWTTFY